MIKQIFKKGHWEICVEKSKFVLQMTKKGGGEVEMFP